MQKQVFSHIGIAWKGLVPLLGLLVFISSCATEKELSTVSNVDMDRYIGKWYEIARLPNSFERDMVCVTATYSYKRNRNKIQVFNEGYKTGRELKYKSSLGTARIPDNQKPGELKVSFFYPFSGDYYIIHLDEQGYQYALVGSPSRKYLWILSRTPQLATSIYNRLIQIATEKGFDVDKLIKTTQICEN
jgi:lipocalin